MAQLPGSEAVTITGAQTVDVGKTIAVTAGESITLTVGKASITMMQDGTIRVNGKDITLDGTGAIVGTAKKDMTLKAKKILQN